MKRTIMIGAGFIVSLLVITACGGLEVSVDDELVDGIDCAVNDRDCDDGDVGDGGSDDAGDVDSTGSAGSKPSDSNGHEQEQGEGTNEDDKDTGGGVVIIEDYERDRDAIFLGTFMAQPYSSDYWQIAHQCDYSFPETIRGYSHDDVIDFETSLGSLAFVADIYPDETFDFEVWFQNSVGQPTVQVTCTCLIEPAYYTYHPAEIQCGCEGTDSEDLCLRYWDKL